MTPTDHPYLTIDIPHPDHPRVVITGACLLRMKMNGQTDRVLREVRDV
jgi:hypothetical protein